MKTAKTIAKEIEKSFRENRRLLLDSMKGLNTGSAAYLNRVVALSKLEQSYRQERAERGLDPENLGAVVTVVYDFRATTETAPDERSAERKLWEENLDREYNYSYGDTEDDDEDGGSSAPQAATAPTPHPRRPRPSGGKEAR
jgi:hypothetical protein